MPFEPKYVVLRNEHGRHRVVNVESSSQTVVGGCVPVYIEHSALADEAVSAGEVIDKIDEILTEDGILVAKCEDRTVEVLYSEPDMSDAEWTSYAGSRLPPGVTR